MPVRYPKEQMHRIKYTKLTRSETGVFEHVYARRDDIWTIERSTYRSL